MHRRSKLMIEMCTKGRLLENIPGHCTLPTNVDSIQENENQNVEFISLQQPTTEFITNSSFSTQNGSDCSDIEVEIINNHFDIVDAPVLIYSFTREETSSISEIQVLDSEKKLLLCDSPRSYSTLQPVKLNTQTPELIHLNDLLDISDSLNISETTLSIPDLANTYPEKEDVVISQACIETDEIENAQHVPTSENISGLECTNAKKKVFDKKIVNSRKRTQNKENWKRSKTKQAREKGEEYISYKGNKIAKKEPCIRPLCNCKQKCYEKVPFDKVKKYFEEFYKLSVDFKNMYLFKSIKQYDIKRRKVGGQKQHKYSYNYFLNSSDGDIKVCKEALMAVFQIGRKKIDVIQKKIASNQLVPTPDMRGKHHNRPLKVKAEVTEYIISHINSFPAEQSHYSRNKNPHKKYLSPILTIKKMYKLYIEKCDSENKGPSFYVKECTYRKIFCTKFNLSFGFPRSDVCKKCEAGENDDLHKELYKEAFESIKYDREDAVKSVQKVYMTVDLQQTQPLPKLSVSIAFYLRQIWLYNLGIYTMNKNGQKTIMCSWAENVASKGSLEICSSLYYISLLIQNNLNIKHLVIWSDSCSGQNKNFNLIALYQYWILIKRFEIREHKFPIVGHSYLDSDRDFGRIEKKLRKYEKIFTPEMYTQIIKEALPKTGTVVDMTPHFYDIEELKLKMQLINRPKNTLGHKVEFRDHVKWIRVDSFGSYLYKKTYDPYTPFLKVDILKKNVNVNPNVEIHRIVIKSNEISREKKEDIIKQLPFIPEQYRWFYEDI